MTKETKGATEPNKAHVTLITNIPWIDWWDGEATPHMAGEQLLVDVDRYEFLLARAYIEPIPPEEIRPPDPEKPEDEDVLTPYAKKKR